MSNVISPPQNETKLKQDRLAIAIEREFAVKALRTKAQEFRRLQEKSYPNSRPALAALGAELVLLRASVTGCEGKIIEIDDKLRLLP